MPEASIVIKATDRFSDAMKTMRDAGQAFSKDLDGMQAHLDELNKTRATLKVDTQKAREELTAAEKQFRKTGDEADRMAMVDKRMDFENAQRNLKLLNKEAANVERQMQKTGKAFSDTENKANKSKSISGMVQAVAFSGIGDMAKEQLQQIANASAGSLLGTAGGNIFSGAMSSMASGAAIGTMLGGPGLGTALGAAGGAVIGAVGGIVQNQQAKDDAFKSWVQESFEGARQGMEETRAGGSSIAGGREQAQMAFAQRLGSDEDATAYLEQVKTMATKTNYSYDEITGYSKMLLNSYSADQTFGILQTLSDASAGLNLGSSDVNVLIQGLSRMRTTGKTTQEYLNYFSERGVDVYQALANSTGADKSKIPEMVSKGKIGGADAAQAILDYINETYGGLSDKLATTYDAMVDNLGDAEANLQAKMGEGYNEARKSGIKAQTDWTDAGADGALGEGYKAIGVFKANLENQKEELLRKATIEVLRSKDYQDAINSGTDEGAAEAGRMLMEAKVRAEAEYNASEGAQLLRESEMGLIDDIRKLGAENEEYWNAGYELGQAFSKGRLAGIIDNASLPAAAGVEWDVDPGSVGIGSNPPSDVGTWDISPYGSGYATGLERVPYDNFPALLHQGERVQTASEARAGGGSPNIKIEMSGVTIREDADIDRVASELLERLRLAGMAG